MDDKNKPDYQKMAEEYAKIKPFTLTADETLSELRKSYIRIYSLLQKLPRQPQVTAVIDFSVKTARLILNELSVGDNLALEDDFFTRTNYTAIVRKCIAINANALYSIQNTHIENDRKNNNILSLIQDLHLFLLTLTTY